MCRISPGRIRRVPREGFLRKSVAAFLSTLLILIEYALVHTVLLFLEILGCENTSQNGGILCPLILFPIESMRICCASWGE